MLGLGLGGNAASLSNGSDGCMETALKCNVSIFITRHWQLSSFERFSLMIEDYLAVRGLRTDGRWSRGGGWQGGSSCVRITVTIVCVTNSLVLILTRMTKTGKSPGKIFCRECHCLIITLGHKIHWIWNNSCYEYNCHLKEHNTDLFFFCCFCR